LLVSKLYLLLAKSISILRTKFIALTFLLLSNHSSIQIKLNLHLF